MKGKKEPYLKAKKKRKKNWEKRIIPLCRVIHKIYINAINAAGLGTYSANYFGHWKSNH